MEELELKDIADDLVIINKHTIDKLFTLNHCSDCIALYIFYYKTAKWQKTNKIKATDRYVMKSLKWSSSKLTKIKNILKENGLIEIIQSRKNGKIDGWYLKINYLIHEKKLSNTKIKIEDSKNISLQDLVFSRSCTEKTNTINNNINTINNNINANEEQNGKNELNALDKLAYNFNEIWKIYPNKKGRVKSYQYYCQFILGRKVNGITYKLTNEQIYDAVVSYSNEVKGKEKQFILNGSTFFNTRIIDYIS